MQTLTRRLAKRLLILAGAILVCILVLYLAMTQMFDEGELGVLAVLGGLILGVALALCRNGIEVLMRRHMLSGAWGRIRPGGARVVALTGQLAARDTPLTLPFVKGPQLSVAYEVRETPPTKHDQRFRNATGPARSYLHMGGMLAADTLLKLDSIDLPLLGPLMADNFPQTKTPAANLAEPILAHAASPGVAMQEHPSAIDALSLIDIIGTQGHGSFRFEWAKASLADVLGAAISGTTPCDLEIRSIPAGAEVSVVGLYDPAAGGLLPNPNSGLIEVFPGDAREARSEMLQSAGRKFGMGLFLILFALSITLVLPHLLQTSDEERVVRLDKIESISLAELSDALARGLVPSSEQLDELYDRILFDYLRLETDDLLTLLVEQGADPNRMRPDGTLPLIRAAMAADGERVGYLIDAGANPNVRGGPGSLTALEWVADLGQFFVAASLLEREVGLSGEIPDPTRLEWLPDDGGAPLDALADAYAAGQVTPPWLDTNGEMIHFTGGVSDGSVASLRLSDGDETRVHTLRLETGGWRLIRVTVLEEPVWGFDLP
ncbi:ankyrin repeat domain-containing protein [Nitrincola alkalilacustris]|uniref:ankyrin repeat domain-containing protein n=1 Tax=Nitrincola alkalilacustris TaxID=1571224 RepID=UPI00124D5843|nr:ankyrin repeat domain-containing protein [Nitrincola alkalilacustris]